MSPLRKIPEGGGGNSSLNKRNCIRVLYTLPPLPWFSVEEKMSSFRLYRSISLCPNHVFYVTGEDRRAGGYKVLYPAEWGSLQYDQDGTLWPGKVKNWSFSIVPVKKYRCKTPRSFVKTAQEHKHFFLHRMSAKDGGSRFVNMSANLELRTCFCTPFLTTTHQFRNQLIINTIQTTSVGDASESRTAQVHEECAAGHGLVPGRHEARHHNLPQARGGGSSPSSLSYGQSSRFLKGIGEQSIVYKR